MELADRAADAEVVRVLHATIDFDFLAFDAEVGDPMLAATVGASGDVQFQLLVESGQTFIQFANEPAREALGFGERQLAIFGTSAGDGSAQKRRSTHGQSGGLQFGRDLIGVLIGNIHEQQILHDRRADVAIGKTLGQRGRDAKLIGSNAAAQNGGTDIRESRLLLSVNADVVAINIRGRIFVFGGIELETDALFQFGEETIGSVSVLKEEILQSSLFAVLAKLVAGTKNLGYAACYWQHLFGPDKRIQSNGKMWLGGKTAADANGESGFCSAETLAREGGEADVVDLRIRAPDVAAGDGHFELAGQVVELGVAREMTIELESEGRRIIDFVGIETSKRAARDSAGDVAASAGGSKAHAIEMIENVRQRL